MKINEESGEVQNAIVPSRDFFWIEEIQMSKVLFKNREQNNKIKVLPECFFCCHCRFFLGFFILSNLQFIEFKNDFSWISRVFSKKLSKTLKSWLLGLITSDVTTFLAQTDICDWEGGKNTENFHVTYLAWKFPDSIDLRLIL